MRQARAAGRSWAGMTRGGSNDGVLRQTGQTRAGYALLKRMAATTINMADIDALAGAWRNRQRDYIPRTTPSTLRLSRLPHTNGSISRWQQTTWRQYLAPHSAGRQHQRNIAAASMPGERVAPPLSILRLAFHLRASGAALPLSSPRASTHAVSRAPAPLRAAGGAMPAASLDSSRAHFWLAGLLRAVRLLLLHHLLARWPSWCSPAWRLSGGRRCLVICDMPGTACYYSRSLC